jgi:hypothetical protein
MPKPLLLFLLFDSHRFHTYPAVRFGCLGLLLEAGLVFELVEVVKGIDEFFCQAFFVVLKTLFTGPE